MQVNLIRVGHEDIKTGLYFDKEKQLAFQIKEIITGCGYEFMKTTSGLYLLDYISSKKFLKELYTSYVTENREDQVKYIRETSKTWDSWEMEHHMTEAEIDGAAYNVKRTVDSNTRKLCDITFNIINNYKRFNNVYFIINDINEKEIILYTNHGIIFIPTCIAISNFTVKDFSISNENNVEECINEFEIIFSIGRVKHIGYLDRNRMVKSDYTISDCTSNWMLFPKSKKLITSEHGIVKEVNFTNTRTIHFTDNIALVNFPHVFDGFTARKSEIQANSDVWLTSNSKKIITNFDNEDGKSMLVESATYIKSKLSKSVNFVEKRTTSFVTEIEKLGKILVGIVSIILIILLISSSIYFAVWYLINSKVQQSSNTNINDYIDSIELKNITNSRNHTVNIKNNKTKTPNKEGKLKVPKITYKKVAHNYHDDEIISINDITAKPSTYQHSVLTHHDFNKTLNVSDDDVMEEKNNISHIIPDIDDKPRYNFLSEIN